VSQATRTLATLALALAVAAALGLYAWFGVFKKDEHEAKVKDRNERLFAPTQVDETNRDGGFANAEFVKVTVAFKGESTTVVREPGSPWRVIAPLETPADKLVIDQVVSQLQQARFKQVIEEAPDDAALAKYGLKPPQFVITAEAQVGERREQRLLKLEGGIENTFDGTVYLRREGSAQVWSAEGGVRWSLQKTTYDLREKTVLGFEEAQVLAVEVKTKLNSYSLDRDSEKAWRLTKPFQAAADAPTLTGIFGALRQERALSFPEDTAEARKNFESPLVDATFTLEAPTAVRLRFAKVGTQVWLLREEGSKASLAEVSVAAAGQLDRNPGDLKDRRVLSFKKEQIAKIVFHQVDGTEQTVERPRGEDGGLADVWRITAPKAASAKTFKVAAVLWTLGAMKASVFGEENPKDWARFGLDAKARSVALFSPDGAPLARLIIGKEVPGKPTTGYLRGSRNQVVEADISRLGDLPSTLDDLIDRPAVDGGK
jgi:hypothetical protein